MGNGQGKRVVIIGGGIVGASLAYRRSIASDAGTLYACRIAVLPSRASPAPTKVGAVPGSLWLQGM